MVTTIIIISILFIVSATMNIIQLKRQEKLEDYIEELESSNVAFYEFFKLLKTRMSQANSRIRSIDRLGSFESDDEIGFIFNEIREIVDELNGSF